MIIFVGGARLISPSGAGETVRAVGGVPSSGPQAEMINADATIRAIPDSFLSNNWALSIFIAISIIH